MTRNICKIGALFALGLAMAAAPGWAQPDPADAPKAENPPENNQPPRPPGYNRQNARKLMEEGMRNMMRQAGVNDEPTQEVILDYIRTDFNARGQLRDQGTKLFQSVRNGGATDDQLSALIVDYRGSQEAERARRTKAEADLDAKVHFSKNPRLEAMLLLGGLIGEVSGPTIMYGGGGNPAFNGGGNRGRGPAQGQRLNRFDFNKNGKLDPDEEAAWQKWRDERRQNNKNDQPPIPPPPPNGAPQGGPPPAEPAVVMANPN